MRVSLLHSQQFSLSLDFSNILYISYFIYDKSLFFLIDISFGWQPWRYLWCAYQYRSKQIKIYICSRDKNILCPKDRYSAMSVWRSWLPSKPSVFSHSLLQRLSVSSWLLGATGSMRYAVIKLKIKYCVCDSWPDRSVSVNTACK